MSRTAGRDDVLALRDAATAALSAGRHDEAKERFAAAARLAGTVLPVTDAGRLALAGAHADAWFEHWGDTEQALRIAGAAYDDAVFEIDGVHGEPYRAAVAQLGELRDRMTFWAFTLG